jgi:hypothetical protein
MRLKLFPMALALAALPALAQDSSEAFPAGVHHTHPMQFLGVRPDGTVMSPNWSGYVVTGSQFTSAQGSWTVPSVDCSRTPNSESAFWVGIDGYLNSSQTVEQTGTDSDCRGTTPRYYAWYEFYPHGSVIIDRVTVAPGDVMSASVEYSNSEFTLTITNQTTGHSFSKTGTVQGARRSSAEWIVEKPEACLPTCGLAPLSDFGTVYLGQDYTNSSGTNFATDSSTSGAIEAFGTNVQMIVMSNNGTDNAVPSTLTSDGTSFDVKWEHK